MFVIIGWLVVFGCVFGGYIIAGGKMAVILGALPVEMTIIGGSAVGAFLVGTPFKVVKQVPGGIVGALKGKPYKKEDYLELLSMMYTVFRTAKTGGLAKLEKDLDTPEDSDFFKNYPKVQKNKRGIRFICDYLRLISLGSDKVHEIEALMDEEIEIIQHENMKAAKALQTMADGLPALGIVAAVLGVIKTMGAITEPPEVLGKLIGSALVGTFLGVLLAYGVVGPLAAAVKAYKEAESAYFLCIKAGIVAFLNGGAPQICTEYARKVIGSETQPTFFEVESATSMAQK
jgi:chemotaxis protein MotA